MAFKPLHDRVLVRRTESEEKTKGGLIIPDSAKEKRRRTADDERKRHYGDPVLSSGRPGPSASPKIR